MGSTSTSSQVLLILILALSITAALSKPNPSSNNDQEPPVYEADDRDTFEGFQQNLDSPNWVSPQDASTGIPSPSLGAGTSLVTFRRGRDPPNSSDCPAKCQCGKAGTSVNCVGKGLTDIPEGIPSQVETLYLDRNNFGVLKPGALENFQFLSKVYLRSCKIQTVSPGAFHNLSLLQELYLGNNNIDQLQPEAFQKAGALYLLNLQANRLTSVPDLHTLPGLTNLVLEANRIQNGTFPEGYSSLQKLSTVVLSNNNLTELTNGTFTTLANCSLRRLEISRSNIKRVEAGALTPLVMLQSLKIGYNPIDGEQLHNLLEGLSADSGLVSLDIRMIDLRGSLPSVSFSILAHTPLITLHFRNNEVGTIPAKAFANLPKLTTLDLQICKISVVDPQAFSDLPALQLLFLNNNALTTVPKTLPSSLTKLYLQFNSLSALKGGDFSNLGKLQELYLSTSGITEVNEDSFLGLNNLVILHLNQNKLSNIPKKLFSYTPKLRILNLRNNNIQSLKPNPGAMASLTSLLTLDMSHNNCGYIPFDYFTDLTSLENLDLSYNRLGGLMAGDVSGRLLSGMVNLQRLSLESNNINFIYDAQFQNLHKLANINLKNNRISSWGPKLFYTPGTLRKTLKTVDLSINTIALVNETSVRDLQFVQMLNLSTNPFACTCDLRWFRAWLENTTINVANKTKYTCNSPAEWEHKLLWTFGADKINCTDYTWYYVGAAIGATFLIALFVFYIIYRRRWFIRLRLYRLRKAMSRCCFAGKRRAEAYERIDGEELPGGGKRYEFYVIAAESDQEFVEEELLPKLDNGHHVRNDGQRYAGNYRLYYEPRDAQVNRREVELMDENMPLCHFALIVLTKNLQAESWSRFLVEMAYHLKAEGILEKIHIIKCGQVALRQIPSLMHRAFERNEYIHWTKTAEHLELALGLESVQAGQGQKQAPDEGQGQGRYQGEVPEEVEHQIV
uniref:Toll-like recptor 11 n=1 Tax=Oncomelania hupensis TaxID=56141 RepID=A0A2H4HHW4_9CAEN|nr:toll-like recptor 11 [Oncomelania hupensis]